MKKIVVAVIMLILLFLNIPTTLDKVLKKDGEYTLYTSDVVVRDGMRVVKNGDTYLVSCAFQQIKSVKSSVKRIKGESFKLCGDENTVAEMISVLSGRVSNKIEIDGIVILEGFSPLLRGSVEGKNGKTNFQIALSKGTVTIGRPVIFGSF